MLRDDDGTSDFSRVTGEQPLVPHILPPSFNLTQLAIQLHQLPHELKLTRRKEIDSQILEEIKTCQYVWIRIDRVNVLWKHLIKARTKFFKDTRLLISS